VDGPPEEHVNNKSKVAAAILAAGVAVGGWWLVSERGNAGPPQTPPARGASVEGPAEVAVRVARQATPSVVSIATGFGSGSGVIVDRDGTIITNAHVVGDSRTVRVGLQNGVVVPGVVRGLDPSVDIAVVQIGGSNYPSARIGDSDSLLVGQTAVAIGNPLGLERTVTVGVVSAVNRSIGGTFEPLIQTDAAINPGNSGGPLLNARAEVIGINTVVLRDPASGGVATGLGFAIPIRLATEIVRQILATGYVRRAYLGISYDDLVPELAAQFGLPVQRGIILTGVGPGTPAAAGGLRPGDIVTEISGRPVTSGGDLRRFLREQPPGVTADIEVLRPDPAGAMRTLRIPVRLSEATP
jgi:S1-C subfamily serine protease